ncbi:MAG: hypothetical protein SPE01_05320 [Candidatus Spyradocola sp.]|nr:hypothetical protein [Candidatus Spyradocola sp.]
MDKAHFHTALSFTLVTTAFWIALLGGIALGSRLLPARWYDHKNAFFRTREWELKFYDALHIRAWKDYLPELGGIVGFAKDRLPESVNERYLDRFLWETCYTEAAHWICMFAGYSYLGLLPLLETPQRYLGLFLGICTFNFFAHLPFIFIQRYNRPRLEMLRDKFDHAA